MNGAPSSAIPSIGSSVPSKTGSPVLLSKSAISSDTGACGAARRVPNFERRKNPAATSATASPVPAHLTYAGRPPTRWTNTRVPAFGPCHTSICCNNSAALANRLCGSISRHRRTISQSVGGIVLSSSPNGRASSFVRFQSFPIVVSARKGVCPASIS